MPLEIDVLTLFPAMIEAPLAASIPGRIQERGLVEIRARDLREWGIGRHRSVDDAPYGGGAGMVMRPEPIAAGIEAVRRPASLVILLDPAGRRFDQRLAHDLAARSHLVFVCPRYEGIDDRVRALVDLELSIGDYVLTGGELPALVVIDAVIRLLPGAIDEASTAEESFADGLLEYPQYTRPPSFRGNDVPTSGRGPVLYSAVGRPGRPFLSPIRGFTLPTKEQDRLVTVLDEIVSDQLRTDLPEIASGDTVKVSAKVVEGNRERIQVFEGTVMRLRGGGITRSITVRRIASGVGVERTFKINSPRIEKIEVVRHGQVRRAQLYFLRKRVGKAATLRERRTNR
jgi:tRNA (guanine37-N1)-methyltransferase